MYTEFSTIFVSEKQSLGASMFEGRRAESPINNRSTRVADLVGIKWRADWRRPGQLGRYRRPVHLATEWNAGPVAGSRGGRLVTLTKE
jgi:hypothetical protein